MTRTLRVGMQVRCVGDHRIGWITDYTPGNAIIGIGPALTVEFPAEHRVLCAGVQDFEFGQGGEWRNCRFARFEVPTTRRASA